MVDKAGNIYSSIYLSIWIVNIYKEAWISSTLTVLEAILGEKTSTGQDIRRHIFVGGEIIDFFVAEIFRLFEM